MPALRLVAFGSVVVACAAVAVVPHGQSTPVAPLAVIESLGLPGIDEGVIAESTHAPGTPAALRRSAVAASLRGDRHGSSGAPYVPGRVIVKFRDSASTTARVSAMSAVSRTASMGTRPVNADFDIVTMAPAEDAEAVARDLASRPDVEYAQAAYRVHTLFVPNDPLYKTRQWNLPLIDMERAWDIQPLAGSSITVAVVDTGIAYMNATLTRNVGAWTDDAGLRYPALGPVTIPYSAAPELVTAATAGRIVAPHDFIWNSTTPLDFDGHGTHVSGTIGQLTNDGIGTAGIAFNVKLMPVKVIDSDWDAIFGSPFFGTDDTVAQGIRYAADNGAKIINLSIGRTGPAAPAIESAINYAVGKGAFLAVAGGNEFEQGNPTEVIAEIASRVKGAVSVGAVDPAKNRAYYSNTGPWIEMVAPGGSERAFGSGGFVWQQTFDYNFTDTFLLPPAQYSAPRFDVFGYIGYIGTSMATPHVSGVAAMLMQQGVTDPAAIEAALERFATDLGTPGRDNTFGYGLVNARNTLRGLGLAQ